MEKEKKTKPLALNAEDAYINFQSIISLYVVPGVKSKYFGRYSAYIFNLTINTLGYLIVKQCRKLFLFLVKKISECRCIC